jgi:glucose-1-phosphate cytidylyltransferase
MKVLILAGGFGTRISEESADRPKPMIEIGGKPILWHIMKGYSAQGFNEFVILLGYKAYMIKEYFANYFLYQSDMTIDLANNQIEVHNNASEPWKVTLLDTGLNTMTGGRVLRARDYVNNEAFMLTYGDGVANVNLAELLDFHHKHGKALTMTSIQPEGRFGALAIADDQQVLSFKEKPKGDGNWINGGFFVCEPKIFDYIKGDQDVFEQEPLENLAKEGELFTFQHKGFWQCMDTLRDKIMLEKLWENKQASWKNW